MLLEASLSTRRETEQDVEERRAEAAVRDEQNAVATLFVVGSEVVRGAACPGTTLGRVHATVFDPQNALAGGVVTSPGEFG